ncbi:AraC family transcriptional regulator [Aggregicoccus sp. 17bor-14]|uniref:AraC family transcriptional regulator n=1 Tax=Myxococcaceae TaxID=31 RepID=UPI00129CAC63|nr:MULTISPECIES: AraC family transcriptional regulator [Myxococcaceae]MBF5045971.1 AraC family transcriptional regulator [Simulacricoccus sp. 17bor-14]MRI91703.1 AraC family transcriptional regulator [Aggregicoccus sp. 17bor-14]
MRPGQPLHRAAAAAAGSLLLALALGVCGVARAQGGGPVPADPRAQQKPLYQPAAAQAPAQQQQQQQPPETVEEVPTPSSKVAVMPPGWFLAGLAPHHYEVTLDAQSACEGSRAAHVRSKVDQPAGYGTFMQIFRADDYRGKRVRYSAVVRTKNVQGWAGLFMRVDGRDAAHPLAFDNMQTRALVGDTPCQRHEVVLDVPRQANFIALGLMLSGTGDAWVGGVRFDVVDSSVASTDLLGGVLGSGAFVVDGPANLGFQPDVTEDQATGRVGGVWFNRVRVENGQRGARLKDGVWHGVFTDMKVNGRTVEGTFDKREGRFTVSREGQVTRVLGTWGKYPVDIRMGPDRLDMRWGERERTLTRTKTETVDPNCVRYVRSDGGLSRIDQLDVCGEALVPVPPVAQLVIALLANGFERPARVDSIFAPNVGEPHQERR